MKSVKLENVRVRFARSGMAIDNFSAAFQAGSFTALVGASGCGKSTLLRLIAGLQAPSAGKIDGAGDKKIGFVFQEPTLLAWRSVRDNIALPLRIQGLGREQIGVRLDEVLTLVGLASRADAVPRELSGGMKMRVSLARALAQQPDVLLMDEPFGALDELARHRLDDELRAIWQQRKCTIIFVTHSMSEAAYLAERVLVIRGAGQLQEEVTIERGAAESDFRTRPAFHEACRAIAAALGHEAA